MPKVYLANKWANLLPCRGTCEKTTCLNSWETNRELEMMATTDDGGGESSFRALITKRESPSRIKSCIRGSFANCRPISTAFALISTALRGAQIFLLRAPIVLPSWGIFSTQTNLLKIKDMLWVGLIL